MKMNEKPAKADRVRRNLIEIFMVIIVPVVSILLYRQILVSKQGEFLTNEFFPSETGQLVMIGIALISAIVTGIVYENLFPKYKDDVNW